MLNVDYAKWVDPSPEDWGTEHLPEEVVKQPFRLVIDSQTEEDNPRAGGCWFSLNLDGKENLPVTPEEKEYILTIIDKCLDGLPGKPFYPDA